MNFMSGRPGFYEEITATNNNNISSSSSSNLAGEEIPNREGTGTIEMEHMFDKVVTPSDVGKLNRLVIPKQNAEKYFPLDSSTNDKGLVLNFEDRAGKPWRFRYSYWNSSQSYVMTKGWSRFVKEKKLDAGDIVSFHRESGKDRLFIDWRRRPDAPDPVSTPINAYSIPHQFSYHRNPIFLRQNIGAHHHYGPYAYTPSVVTGNPCPPGSIVYLGSSQQNVSFANQLEQQRRNNNGYVDHQMVFESVPVVQGKVAAKRLRLFGVNMDCPITESDDCDLILSTQNSTKPPPFSSSSNHDKGKGSMSLDLDI